MGMGYKVFLPWQRPVRSLCCPCLVGQVPGTTLPFFCPVVSVAVSSDTAPSLQPSPCHWWMRADRIELNRLFQMEEAFSDHTV